MTHARASVLMSLALLSGCSDRGLPAQSPGYLATDKCIQAADATTCASRGCQWTAVESTVAPAGGDGAPAGTFVCVGKDPCLDHDEAACRADSICAWSQADALCPIGADCAGGGFCHVRSDVAGDCGCVSPVACPADGACPKVECDCSNGGAAGGGGGACTCACPPCAPGELCPPCACDCVGGVSGGGCGDVGTCACACPACAPGETCPPCDCTCGSGGGTTVTPGGDPTAPQPSDPPCACDCAPCAPGATCPPCACTCGSGPVDGGTVDAGTTDGGTTGTTTTCVPPPAPSPTPIACPATGCFADCPSGYKTGSDGCPTCECL